jgi:hypothetical protein
MLAMRTFKVEQTLLSTVQIIKAIVYKRGLQNLAKEQILYSVEGIEKNNNLYTHKGNTYAM